MPANGNVDYAFGIRPLKTRMGAETNGQLHEFVVPDTDATPIFRGSPIKLAGDADPVLLSPTVALAAPGDVVKAIALGFQPQSPSHLNPSDRHRKANERRVVLAQGVTVGEEYEIQADGILTGDMLGKLFDLTAEAGNTMTGRSTVELDVSTASDTTGQCRLERIIDSPNHGFDAADPGVSCVVTFNENLQAAPADGGV